MDHLNKIHNHTHVISESLSKYISAQQNVLKGVISYIESPIKAIQKSLSRYMYVQPWIFEFLLKVKLGKKKDKKGNRKGRYTIYTRLQMHKKVINPSIDVDKPTLDALKLILQNYLLHILQFGNPEERMKILEGIKTKLMLYDGRLIIDN